jgi:hypothetical protein
MSIWEEYARDGEKTYELFVQVQEAYGKSRNNGIRDILGKRKKKSGPSLSHPDSDD